jgi:hypothetical protein
MNIFIMTLKRIVLFTISKLPLVLQTVSLFHLIFPLYIFLHPIQFLIQSEMFESQ